MGNSPQKARVPSKPSLEQKELLLTEGIHSETDPGSRPNGRTQTLGGVRQTRSETMTRRRFEGHAAPEEQLYFDQTVD